MATARMTKSEAGRLGAVQHGAHEMMRHAARNLRFCQMRAMGTANVDIASEAGLSPSRTSRIISKGEDHWQRWLERAMEEGVEQEDVVGAVPEPEGVERVEMIDIRLIGPNPFQPRTKFTAAEVGDLMADILDNGQRIPITIRPSVHVTDAPYELCWGQLRLEAFREAHEMARVGEVYSSWVDDYYDRDSGVTKIKAIIREMDDADLRRGAASENLNRNNMCWSDTIRALDDLVENTDSTAAEVAVLAKMSPQQLSNQRRLLRLPDAILDMVDDDVLAWTSARELLVFATPTHTHRNELDYCLNRLTAKMRKETDGDGNHKRIPADSVRTIVTNALSHSENHRHWEPLIDSNHIYMGDGNSHGKRHPKFDIGEFGKLYREYVHKIPRPYGSASTEAWTCAVDPWRDWQAAAEEEERQVQELRAAELAAEEEEAKQLGPIATKFSTENPRAEHLPRQILHMLEGGHLTETFVHRLLNFVHPGTHAHEGYLEEISDGLQSIVDDQVRVGLTCRLPDAAAGGVVLKALRKDLDYTSFRSLDDRLTRFGFDAPRFAMDEFIERQRPLIHCVPIGIGIVRVTCTYEAWDWFQEKAAESVKRQIAQGNQPSPPADEEPAAQLIDMTMVDVRESQQIVTIEAGLALMAAADALEPWVYDDKWRSMDMEDAVHVGAELEKARNAILALRSSNG